MGEFYLQLEFLCLQLSFFAYSPFRRSVQAKKLPSTTLSNCKQGASKCKQKRLHPYKICNFGGGFWDWGGRGVNCQKPLRSFGKKFNDNKFGIVCKLYNLKKFCCHLAGSYVKMHGGFLSFVFFLSLASACVRDTFSALPLELRAGPNNQKNRRQWTAFHAIRFEKISAEQVFLVLGGVKISKYVCCSSIFRFCFGGDLWT